MRPALEVDLRRNLGESAPCEAPFGGGGMEIVESRPGPRESEKETEFHSSEGTGGGAPRIGKGKTFGSMIKTAERGSKNTFP